VHLEGPGLDLMVEWSAGAGTARDLATRGGHAARSPRDGGPAVVSTDPAPGREPDVVCAAGELPFPDERFDVIACMRAARHVRDVSRALGEIARVSRALVLIGDAVSVNDELEAAQRLGDPSPVSRSRAGESSLLVIASRSKSS